LSDTTIRADTGSPVKCEEAALSMVEKEKAPDFSGAPSSGFIKN
jgi:hypothetical protein